MNKIYSILAFFAFTNSFGQPVNLVQNPSFENGSFSPWSAGMSGSYVAPELIQNPNQAYAGDYYVKYNPKSTTGFYQNIATVPGKSYFLSFWYKSGSLTTHARLWSSFMNETGRTTNLVSNVLNDPLRNYNEWLPYAPEWTLHLVEFTTPTNYPILQLGLRAYLGGVVSFDEFSVEEKRFVIRLSVDDLEINSKNLVVSTVVTDVIQFRSAMKNIELISVNGQKVQKKAVEALERLNIQTLPSGVYYLKGEIDGKVVSQKIIKK